MEDAAASTQGDRRPLIALLVANTISQIGNGMAMLAIPWFVLSTTGSASSTAITVAVGAFPAVVAGIFGGAIVDRLGYKASSITSDAASGVTLLLIPVLHQTVGIAFWQLLVLVFLGALLDAPGSSARRSMFPELVEQAGISVDRGNATFMVTGRLAGLLSAPLGGVLIAWLGAANLLYVDAATFFISIAIIATRIPAPPVTHEAPSGVSVSTYLRDVREGFAFLFGDRLLRAMLTSFAMGGLLAEPLYAVILPVYIEDRYDNPTNLGLIFGGLAVGSLVGNAIFAAWSTRLSRSVILIGGFAVRGLVFTVLAFSPEWWVIALAIFIGAVAFEPINPQSMTILQERVPTGMRGRVLGASTAMGMSAFPIGILVFGWLLDTIGLDATLAIFVGVNLALPIAMWLTPALRSMSPPSTAEQREAPAQASPLTPEID